MVGTHGEIVSGARGIPFFKMSGSGNDFVVVDARTDPQDWLQAPAMIQAMCARGTGVGADGVVLLASERDLDFRMIYYNADGSRASMCGNAALCCTRLATEIAGGEPRELQFMTDSGRVAGRVRGGRPEIDLAAVSVVHSDARVAVAPPERRIGFAIAGVPHLTVMVEDVEEVDLPRRGRALRFAPELGPEGANANFVARDEGEWAIRTYERGVEGETLACGTGAVASAILIQSWGLAEGPVNLRTRSGRMLSVTLRRSGGEWMPTLAGEGRIVFRGELAEL